MKIGIYGGTFNPPHLGHLTSARFALEELKLDKLLFVPAALPPHKTLPGESASPQERWEMISLAADSLLLPGRVEVCDRGRATPRILWRSCGSSTRRMSCGC